MLLALYIHSPAEITKAGRVAGGPLWAGTQVSEEGCGVPSHTVHFNEEHNRMEKLSVLFL